jgi:lysylphosphatidylglycerol synthetase-like protein (DUF2156 family)
MTRKAKVALGVGAASPFVYAAIFVAAFLGVPTDGSGAVASAGRLILTAMVPLGLVTSIIMLASAVWFLLDIMRNGHLSPRRQVVWVAAVLVGGIVVMPVYWILHIWRREVEPS